MEDIAPELYDKIQKKYRQAVKNDSRLISIANKIRQGKGTQADLDAITKGLGRHLSDAMRKVLVVDNLPDGKMYWNIAEKTIKPALESVYGQVNRYATLEQRAADVKHGVNLAVQSGTDPSHHIRKVMEYATNSVSGTELDNALNEPVKTAAGKFLDDFKERNAEIRAGAGVIQYVVREYDGVGLKAGACNWCLERAGIWKYEDAKANGVFERHDGCGCTIDVVYEDGLTKEQTNWHHNEWADANL